jgi:hypothetical protein
MAFRIHAIRVRSSIGLSLPCLTDLLSNPVASDGGIFDAYSMKSFTLTLWRLFTPSNDAKGGICCADCITRRTDSPSIFTTTSARLSWKYASKI